MAQKNIEFSAKEEMSYGSWRCPSCGSHFYGGGPASHNSGCKDTGYGNCIQIVGEKAIATIQNLAASYGDDYPHPFSGITLNDLRQHLPQHV